MHLVGGLIMKYRADGPCTTYKIATQQSFNLTVPQNVSFWRFDCLVAREVLAAVSQVLALDLVAALLGVRLPSDGGVAPVERTLGALHRPRALAGAAHHVRVAVRAKPNATREDNEGVEWRDIKETPERVL